MKTRLPLLCLSLSLCGCVSTQSGTAPATAAADVAKIAPFVTQLVQSGVPLVLDKNPQYAPVVGAVATAVPAAFTSGTLDAKSISGTIAILGARYNLTPEVQSAISMALLDAVTWYQSTYGAKVASATDPNVQTLLTAFAAGLNNGLTVWQNSQPKP